MNDKAKQCVVCDTQLIGGQRLFCSERCKQAAKYEQRKGERCKYCKKSMKPTPIMGGYAEACARVNCVNSRNTNDKRRKT